MAHTHNQHRCTPAKSDAPTAHPLPELKHSPSFPKSVMKMSAVILLGHSTC